MLKNALFWFIIRIKLNYRNIYSTGTFLALLDIKCHSIAFVKGPETGSVDS